MSRTPTSSTLVPAMSASSYSRFLLDGLRGWQAPVSASVRTLVGLFEPWLPSRYVRYPDVLPSVRDVVEGQLAFAEELLSVQRDFATALLDAASPALACEVDEASAS